MKNRSANGADREEMARDNIVEPNDTALNEPSQLDLHCL